RHRERILAGEVAVVVARDVELAGPQRGVRREARLDRPRLLAPRPPALLPPGVAGRRVAVVLAGDGPRDLGQLAHADRLGRDDVVGLALVARLGERDRD